MKKGGKGELTPEEVKKNIHRGVKNKKISYWLQPKNYLKYVNCGKK